ncbi:hypothetical protein C5613_11955 [Rhodococcus opacus]|uniref:Uncharacterized protein n=1 Tax=Rhodococcus opacus TaxID=37919 RepID=A0A2S8JC57_RHOOP|nr:hypothetical protein C5613_11955 [Rhodococcus opacus]
MRLGDGETSRHPRDLRDRKSDLLQPPAQRGHRMGVPWVSRARSDAYWEQQVSGEARSCDSGETTKSASSDTRPTLADHSLTHRNTDATDAPPADHSE